MSDGARLPPAIITHFEPIGGQLLMPFLALVEARFVARLVYVDDIAARLKPFDEFPNVIIDPRFALGRPVVKSGYVPTDTLAAAFLAEGDIDDVAEWYGTDRESVTQAVAFEQRLAA